MCQGGCSHVTGGRGDVKNANGEPRVAGRMGETGRSQDKTDAGHNKAGEGNEFHLVCSQARKANK